MNDEMRRRAWRWPLVIAIPHLIAWIWFYLANGYFLASTVIGFWNNNWVIFTLPVAIPRLIDVPVTAMMVSLIVVSLDQDLWSKNIDTISWWDCARIVNWLTLIVGVAATLFLGAATGFVSTLITITVTWPIFVCLWIIARVAKATAKWASGG